MVAGSPKKLKKNLAQDALDHSRNLLLALSHAVQSMYRVRTVQQMQAEEQLQTSMSTYEGIFNGITEAIYILDENGVFLRVNLGAEKMYGYPPEDFIGRTPEFLSAPRKNDLAKVVEYVHQAYLGQSVEFEFWGLRKDGAIFPKDVRLTPGTYFGKRVVIAVGRDTTRRKQAEEALRAAEKDYRSIFEQAPVGIIQSTPAGRYTKINTAMAHMFGYDSSQDMIESIKDISSQIYVDPSVRREFMRLLDEKDGVFDFESQNKCKDGSHIWTSVNARTVRDEAGEILCYEGFVRDITKRKHAEEFLRASEAKNLALLNAIPDMIFVLNRDGVFLDYHAPKGQATYVPSESFLGKNIREVMPPQIVESYISKLSKAMQSGESQLFEYALDSAGRRVYFEAKIVVYVNDNILTVTRDITQRKQAEETLRASEEKSKSLYQLIRLMTDNMPDMVWAKDMDGRYLFANKAMIEKLLIAKDTEEPIGKTDMYFVERQRAAHLENPNWHTFGELCVNTDGVVHAGKKAERFEEFGNVKGKFLFLDVYKAPFLDEQGNMIGTVGVGRDVTLEKKLEEEHQKFQEALSASEAELRAANKSLAAAHHKLQQSLEQEQVLARTDGLTGLCNRRYFYELAAREFHAAIRYQRPLTIILFDVDGLKQFNDTFGHALGDIVLTQIAQTTAAQIRDVDMLARYGGDEFIILLPQTSAQQAFQTAERIRQSVASIRVGVDKNLLAATLSIGVAEINYTPQDESIEGVIRRADKALYAAKKSGRNHVIIFSEI